MINHRCLFIWQLVIYRLVPYSEGPEREKDGDKGNCNANEEVEIIHLISGDYQMVLLLLLLTFISCV